jgi:pimeloyl-ACP methyl ester carboxylesterase
VGVFGPAGTIAAVSGLFVPGWGADPALYAPGLPAGWEIVRLPSYATTGGELSAYRSFLDDEIARRGRPVVLAGHSMGAALAILVAADRPADVERLILLSPAGLPITKPFRSNVVSFVRRVLRNWRSPGDFSRALGGSLRSPRAAIGLARAVHGLDVSRELELVRASGIPSTVVACSTDRLTTPDHCRRLAGLLGSDYREVEARGGHMWMIAEPALLTAALSTP